MDGTGRQPPTPGWDCDKRCTLAVRAEGVNPLGTIARGLGLEAGSGIGERPEAAKSAGYRGLQGRIGHRSASIELPGKDLNLE